MKTLLRLSAGFFALTLGINFLLGSRALAQVFSYPYSYGWDPATSFGSTGTGGGDGNYNTSSAGGAPKWATFPINGVGNSPCVSVAGFKGSSKESFLDLVLKTTGITFNSGETYNFSVALAEVPEDTGVGKIRVQENSNGSFVDIPGSTADLFNLSTTHSTYLGGVVIPSSMGNKASVTLRIVIRSLKNNVYTPQVFVDDNSVFGGALPIQLASSAVNVIRDNEVEVSWRTVSETNNYGFEIYRKRGEISDWRKIGFIDGHGTTLAPQSYSYLDRSVSFGKYYYRIKQIDLDGKSETFPEMEVSVGTGPEKFVLAQNYPNPFNPSTLIDFVVPQSGYAALRVYNVLGQEVVTLFEGNADAGKIYTTRFSASELPSGLYFYTLRSSGRIETKRMLLMK